MYYSDVSLKGCLVKTNRKRLLLNLLYEILLTLSLSEVMRIGGPIIFDGRVVKTCQHFDALNIDQKYICPA